MNRRIALTGATGFVGGHLLDELVSCGYQVNALTRRPQPAIPNVKWISGGLDDHTALSDLVRDVNIIINVAGAVKASSKTEFEIANNQSVGNLLEACKDKDKQFQFIQISTLAAREKNISDYARSKFNGEQRIQQSEQKNINWTIIRPPAVYGPADKETLKIFRLLKWRVALIPNNSENRASWIHVSDLARAICSVMDNQRYYGKTIEIDDGVIDGYSHGEFYSEAARILNVNPLKITIPENMLKLVGYTNDFFAGLFKYAPMLSSQKVNELCHKDWTSDKQNTIGNDDWQAHYDLKEGLEQTLDWYKKNKYI